MYRASWSNHRGIHPLQVLKSKHSASYAEGPTARALSHPCVIPKAQPSLGMARPRRLRRPVGPKDGTFPITTTGSLSPSDGPCCRAPDLGVGPTELRHFGKRIPGREVSDAAKRPFRSPAMNTKQASSGFLGPKNWLSPTGSRSTEIPDPVAVARDGAMANHGPYVQGPNLPLGRGGAGSSRA